MTLLLEDLRNILATRPNKVVFIIGTGVCVGAVDSAFKPCATWAGLLDHGLQRAHGIGAIDRRTLEVYQEQLRVDEFGLIGIADTVTRHLNASDGNGEFSRWLYETVGQFAIQISDNSVLNVLAEYQRRGALLATTNYDHLLEGVTGLKPVTWRQAAAVERAISGKDPRILHLHGEWEDPASIVLGTRSYDNVVRDKFAQTVLVALRTDRTFVFVGCGTGLRDPNMGAFLRWTGEVFRGSEARHFRLCLAGEAELLRKEHPQEQRLFPLPYGDTHADLAPFLRGLLPDLPPPPVKSSPVVSIPQPSIVPPPLNVATQSIVSQPRPVEAVTSPRGAVDIPDRLSITPANSRQLQVEAYSARETDGAGNADGSGLGADGESDDKVPAPITHSRPPRRVVLQVGGTLLAAVIAVSLYGTLRKSVDNGDHENSAIMDVPAKVPPAKGGDRHDESGLEPKTTVPATLESLLGLVHADSTYAYTVLSKPAALLELGDETFKFYYEPVQTLLSMLGQPEIASGFAAAKTFFGELRSKLATSGVDLERGIVITKTGPEAADTILLVSAAQAHQVTDLMTALNLPGLERTVCKMIDAAPGYIGCADAEAVLTAYKPGDGFKRRQAAEAGLPGIPLDELTLLGYSPDDGGTHIAMSMPHGTVVLHVGLPGESEETKDAMAALEPGPATTLRFAWPGTGFVWARMDMAEMKRRMPDLAKAPPPAGALIAAWNGELFFGGSSDPAAMQLRLGLTDVKPAGVVVAALEPSLRLTMPSSIPGITGSKVAFETKVLTFGSETTKTAHISLTGIDEASIISHFLGLSLDAWIFAVDNSMALAIGADATNIVRLAATPNVDASLATLPLAATDDLRAGRASFIMHLPLDSMQGPSLRKALDAALKNVPGYKSDQTRIGMALLAPVSSTTMWITEQAGIGVAHLAIRGIGNSADYEGTAALTAAAAVARGGDPTTLFGELATKFPGSPRLAAYQARAGTIGAGALTGSAVGGMVLTGAIIYALSSSVANPDLGTEPGVPQKPVNRSLRGRAKSVGGQ